MKVLNILLAMAVFGSTVTPLIAETSNEIVPLAAAKPLLKYRQGANGVILEVKQYPLVGQSSKPSKKKRRNKSKAFYPMELEIKNSSLQDLYIDPEMIDIDLINYKKIATQMIKSDEVNKVLLYGGIPAGVLTGAGGAAILGAFTYPVSGSLFGGGLYSSLLAGLGLAVLGGGLICLGAVVGIGTVGVGIYRNNVLYNQNKEILEARVLHDTFVIKPGETLSKLVFINEQDCQPTFKMHLENDAHAKYTFDVKLAPKPSLA